MDRLRFSSKFTWIAFSLLAFLASGAQAQQFITGIDLDSWTKILINPKGTNTFQAPTDQQILRDRRNEVLIFEDLRNRLANTKLIASTPLKSAQNYFAVAKKIEEMREEYRYPLMSTIDRRRLLFLMQVLAEEIMYVGASKFPRMFPKVVRNMTPNGHILPGDIILIKTVKSHSSELLPFLTEYRQLFSQVTFIYGTKHKLNDLVTESNTKSRIFIYRLTGQPNEGRIRNAIDEAVQQFAEKKWNRVKGPRREISAFTVFGVYNTAESILKKNIGRRHTYDSLYFAVDGFNPFDKKLWSRLNPRCEELRSTLGIDARATPSPGDLELNRNLELVGSMVNVSLLAQERVESAIDHYLAYYFNKSRSTMLHRFMALLPVSKWMDTAFIPKIRAMVSAQIGSNIIGYDSLYALVARDVDIVWKQAQIRFAKKQKARSCATILNH